MTKTVVVEVCSDCRFFVPTIPANAVDGACRRYPPVTNRALGLVKQLNVVETTGWCGEFQQK